MKAKFTDPILIIAGDFNQWKIQDGLEDFTDIGEADVGCTRGRRSIDRIFTNIGRSITECGSFAPLENDGESKSDHCVAFCKLKLKRREAFRWETYAYRYSTPEAEKAFKQWIVLHDWAAVYEATGSNAKTNAYQKTISQAIDLFFPLKTTRKKSTDLSWLNRGILKLKRIGNNYM